MAIPYELAVVEDLNRGHGTVEVTMPGGGSATGHKINQSSIPWPTAQGGVVHVYPPDTYGGVGIVYAPDGSEIDTTGSTTAGLQEALDYAAANGADLEVHGGGDSSQNSSGAAVVYNIDGGVTLDIPAVQGKRMTWGAVTLNFGGSDATTALRFDSCMMLSFRMYGSQIVSSRVGTVVLFDPRNQVPVDPVTACIDSVFEFGAVANIHAVPTTPAVRLRANTGDITNNRFIYSEINGGITALQVDTPTGGFACAYNHIFCPHLHGQYGTSPIVLVGNAAGATNVQIRDNLWGLHILKDATGGGDGFFTRATRDRGSVALAGILNSQYDVRFADEAALADLVISTDSIAADFASAVLEDSTPANNRVSGLPPARKVTTVGASPYVYPAATDRDVLARDHAFTVRSGTVSEIAVSYDGSTWDVTGVTTGVFQHRAGRRHRITYSSVPTMIAIL